MTNSPAAPRSAITAEEAVAVREVVPAVLVLMGVSGSGKTTVAQELHRILGWPLQEGDNLHPPANIEKMRSGLPLDDTDRRPWLEAIARWIDGQLAKNAPGIITCSDLKRAYRELTIGDRRGVRLVYLKGDRQVIHQRVVARQHRYMPPSLLASQFETLEEPGDDEHPIVVHIHRSVAETVATLLQGLAD